jgi:phospholipid/cholesterol/gamma-HCH transport system ATP-binding protein
MIKFEKVTKNLTGRPVLNDLSFEVQEGETFCIVGPSGVGKSVTLKHMVRLMTPDFGQVHVQGNTISSMEGRDLENVRELFGYLFQGGALLAWLTVAENVALPLREKTGMSETEIQDRVEERLAMVGLEGEGDKQPSEISGGMRKRAGLARALVRNPKIVLYDEPTSGLDPVTSRTIDGLIQRMRNELGVTSVVVTHDLHSALSIGSRIAMLHGGDIVETAAPEDFVKSDNPQVRSFMESQYITRKGSWERN